MSGMQAAGVTTVGIYVRISDDHDGQQTATERQREDCERFAESRGWAVADHFADIDLSAYKRKVKRPEFERMIEAVRSHAIDGVLAWKLDRITRRQRDLVRLDEACEDAGGFIATVVDAIDTRSSTGRFVAELLTAQARMESENTSIRQKRKHAELVAKGKPGVGGNRKFGYSKQSDIIETEAALVREARDRVFAGESMRGIARDWKARGVVTPLGNVWHPAALRRMLMGAQLSGQREHLGVLTPGSWTPVIAPADTTRLRAILGDPARLTRKTTGRSYLLTGLARCGRCGFPLTGAPNGGKRTYVCSKRVDRGNCGGVSRMAEPVEEFVTQMAFEALRGADVREYLEASGDDVEPGIAEAVRDDEAALVELSADFYVSRSISRAQFVTAQAALTARLEANRTRLSNTSAGSMLATIDAGAGLERRWEGETMEWRHTVLSTVVESITIKPVGVGHRVFDPSAIVVKWKF